MIELGTVKPGATIRIPFSSFDKDDGSSITMTNYAAADILVYKDGSTTERASTAGFTATTDFDAKTGKHIAVIDLADNTTAGFWAAGSEYLVAIDAVTVDGVTTGGWIARFRIGYPGALLDTTIASLSSQTSFTLAAGPAEDNALVGCIVMIHDVASAVQCGLGVVTAYTGSTKTVTLLAGVSFTAASPDNISFFPPVNAAYGGGVAYSATRGLAGTALPAVAAEAAGGLYTRGSGAGQLNQNANGQVDSRTVGMAADVLTATAIQADAITAAKLASDVATEIAAPVLAVLGALADAAADGDPTSSDTAMAYIKQLINVLMGTAGIVTFPASAAPGNAVSLAEAIRQIYDEVANLNGGSLLDAAAVRSAVGLASANLDTQLDALPTNAELATALAAADDAVLAAIAALNNLSQANIRTAVGLASANLDTQLDALPTNAELATALGTADDAVLAAVAALNNLSQANVRTAVGLGSANLDTQLAGIQTDADDIQARLPAALTGAGNMKADMLAINGDTTAAQLLEALMDGGLLCQVNDAGATTTAFIADGFTEATNDHFNGRLITFLTGALRYQQTAITDYVGATQTFTVTALTEAPANNDYFVIH